MAPGGVGLDALSSSFASSTLVFPVSHTTRSVHMTSADVARVRLLGAVVLALSVTQQAGCRGDTKMGDRLTWGEGEVALKSTEVKTIADLYSRLADKSKREAQRRYFRDPKSLDEFETMDDFVAEVCTHHPEKTPASVKASIAKDMTWKKENVKDIDAKRVYSVTFLQNTKAERVATWDRPVFVAIFCDDDGVILGWEANT